MFVRDLKKIIDSVPGDVEVFVSEPRGLFAPRLVVDCVLLSKFDSLQYLVFLPKDFKRDGSEVSYLFGSGSDSEVKNEK